MILNFPPELIELVSNQLHVIHLTSFMEVHPIIKDVCTLRITKERKKQICRHFKIGNKVSTITNDMFAAGGTGGRDHFEKYMVQYTNEPPNIPDELPRMYTSPFGFGCILDRSISKGELICKLDSPYEDPKLNGIQDIAFEESESFVHYYNEDHLKNFVNVAITSFPAEKPIIREGNVEDMKAYFHWMRNKSTYYLMAIKDIREGDKLSNINPMIAVYVIM